MLKRQKSQKRILVLQFMPLCPRWKWEHFCNYTKHPVASYRIKKISCPPFETWSSKIKCPNSFFCILHQTIMIFLFSSDFKRLKAFAQTHIKSFQILWQNTRLLLISIKFKVFEGETTKRPKIIIFAHVQNTSKPFSGILVVYQQYCNQCNLGG